MISYLQGKVMANNGSEIVVLTSGGIGFKVTVKDVAGSWKPGSEVGIHTYMAVRENAMDLFGFENEEERALFLKFLDVSGIGPKTAMHVLTLGTVDEISSAISHADVEYLTKVSGIGRKTAERIVVELKNKVTSLTASHPERSEGSNALADTIEGLIAMGYSAQQARDAARQVDAEGKTSEQLLREALKKVK